MPLGADADVTFLEEGGESIPKGLYLLIWWLRNTCSVLLESFLTLSSWNFKETFLFKKTVGRVYPFGLWFSVGLPPPAEGTWEATIEFRGAIGQVSRPPRLPAPPGGVMWRRPGHRGWGHFCLRRICGLSPALTAGFAGVAVFLILLCSC